MTLFALQIDATADGNEYAQGSRQHLLVFVRADSEDAAFAEALVALSDKRWTGAELKQISPFGVAPASIDDPSVREAALKAAEGHRAIVVFDQA